MSWPTMRTSIGRIFKSGLESVTGDSVLLPGRGHVHVLAATARLCVQVGCALGLNASVRSSTTWRWLAA